MSREIWESTANLHTDVTSKTAVKPQESLSDYKKRSKMETLGGDKKLREELIELKMRSMNNKEDFIEVLVEYINSIE